MIREAPAGDGGLDRLVYFSDAVMAIAITLLALELPLPSGADDAALWRSFAHLMGEQYLMFLLSFVVIAAYWAAHHRLFQHLTRSGPGLVRRNTLFLLAIVVLPYATRLLGEEGRSQVATVVYAVAVAGVGLSLLLLLRHARRHGLLRDGTPPRMPGDLTRGVLIAVFAFLASIPIAFVDTGAAKYSWAILSALAAAVLLGIRRRGARRPPTRRPPEG